MTRLRGKATRLVIAVLAAVAGAFVLLRLSSSLDYREQVTAGNAALLAAATLIMAACVYAFALAWRSILQWLGRENQPRSAVRIFIYTWLGRYVPGTLPYHATRLMLADSLGTSKRVVAASIAYEGVLMVGAASFVGVLALLVGLGAHTADALPYVLGGLLVASLPIGLHPRVLVPTANRLLRLTHREPLAADSLLSARQTLILFIAYGGIYLALGSAFYLVMVALGQDLNPAVAVGAFNLAGVAGLLVLLVPSGLGVREAVLVALLSNFVAAEWALLGAGLSRALTIVADLLAPACFALFQLAQRAVRGYSRLTRGGRREAAGYENGRRPLRSTAQVSRRPKP